MSTKMTKAPILASSIGAALLAMTMQAPAADTIASYPNGIQERFEQETRKNHPVIVNRMKKVNGVTTSDDIQWLNGELTRRVYQLPAGQSSERGYDHFVEEFRSLGVKELFSCSSFSCGNSNLWANDMFNIAMLYGQDRQQHYFIGEKQGAYYSVYSVRRGNGRVYAMIDQFQPEQHPGDLAGALTQLDRRGFYDLDISAALEGDAYSMLKTLLQDNQNLKLVLQIHYSVDGGMNSYDRITDKTLKQGQALQRKLAEAGIGSDRLRIQVAATNAGIRSDVLRLRLIKIQ